MQIGTRDGAGNRASQPIDVLGCELVPTGGGQDLLRVTFSASRGDRVRAADVRLIAEDDTGRHVFGALPALPGVARTSTFTIGFALPSSLAGARLTIESGASVTVLGPPAVRRLAPASSAEPNAGPVLEAELRALDFATAAVRAESDRLELETALTRSQEALREAQSELARLQPQPPAMATRSLRRFGRPAVAVAAAAVLCAVIALIVGESSSPLTRTAAVPPAGSAAARQAALARRLGIPPAYLALYRSAGRRYGLDWTMLAAVGDVETENGRAPLPGVNAGDNGLGAIGPAQFLRDTWEDYGLDGDGDGMRDPYDPADAIPAMASYLRASGAPTDWNGALLTYNHSAAYAAEVQREAARYRHAVGR